jgi:hypothetical protein
MKIVWTIQYQINNSSWPLMSPGPIYQQVKNYLVAGERSIPEKRKAYNSGKKR